MRRRETFHLPPPPAMPALPALDSPIPLHCALFPVLWPLNRTETTNWRRTVGHGHQLSGNAECFATLWFAPSPTEYTHRSSVCQDARKSRCVDAAAGHRQGSQSSGLFTSVRDDFRHPRVPARFPVLSLSRSFAESLSRPLAVPLSPFSLSRFHAQIFTRAWILLGCHARFLLGHHRRMDSAETGIKCLDSVYKV
jgi:hypothetical protein